MRIYYAHPMNTYGSAIEKEDIETLAKLGFTVLNPSDEYFQNSFLKYKQENPNNYFQYFSDLVSTCQALAFRAFPGNLIGAGIAAEIKIAEKLGLPIVQLPCQMNRILTISETRTLLKEIGG